MSWEYWSPFQRFLHDVWGEKDAAGQLIEAGYAPPENRGQLAEVLSDHDNTYIEDDSEWDFYCVCGKWLERDQYEMPDHLSSILEDSGLLLPEDQWPVGGTA